MRKKMLQNINDIRKNRKLKRIVTVDRKSKKLELLILGCILMVSVTGCIYKSKGEYLGKIAKSEDEQSDAMMQSIIDALETQDAEALKDLFSPYALGEAEDLDEKIEELMEFYPGCEGGFEGYNISQKRANYGDITLMLNGTYTVSNDEETYEVNFITFPQSDEEPDKIGLYLVEVITQDAKPEGFKFKSENSVPGVYVQE